MSEEHSRKPGEEIKVSDRRSFNSRGERRTPDAPKSEPVRSSGQVPSGVASTPPSEGESEFGIGFDSFVRYLAQVALHQMAGGRDPATGEMVASLEESRQTIEILRMLKHKTRGNLSPQESQTLDDLLYHLKIEFTRRASSTER